MDQAYAERRYGGAPQSIGMRVCVLNRMVASFMAVLVRMWMSVVCRAVAVGVHVEEPPVPSNQKTDC